jgi:hypothetical protein
MEFPADLAASLDDSVFAGRDRVSFSVPGWQDNLAAVNVDHTFPGLDEAEVYRWAAETWRQASEAVRGLPWTPVLIEAAFPATGELQYPILPYADPALLPQDLSSPRWELETWLTKGSYVPEVTELKWDLENHRQGSTSTGVRSRDEIVEYLEVLAERSYAPLGGRPSPRAIAESSDPEGQPIRSLGMAEWWLHRWALQALDEEILVQKCRMDQYLMVMDHSTLLFLPTEEVGAGGLLAGGPGEFAPGQDGNWAWAAFVVKWSLRWGAQLVHTGSMPAFVVERPPSTIAEAIPLALEHQVFSDQADRAGMSIYEWAYALVGAKCWSLTVKP